MGMACSECGIDPIYPVCHRCHESALTAARREERERCAVEVASYRTDPLIEYTPGSLIVNIIAAAIRALEDD